MNEVWKAGIAAQARRFFATFLASLEDLHATKLLLEKEMLALVREYREWNNCSRLILYPNYREKGDPPRLLVWAEVPEVDEKEPQAPGKRRRSGMLINHPCLTDDLIYRVAKDSGRRDRYWDFDRRRLALNAALQVASNSLDSAKKRLHRRTLLSGRPLAFATALPGRDDLAVPSCPPELLLPDLPPAIRDRLRVAWILSHALAYAIDQFSELRRRYQANPASAQALLEFLSDEVSSPRGGLYWILLPRNVALPRISRRILRRYGVPTESHPDLSLREEARRKIARLHEGSAEALDRVRALAHRAVLESDRARVEASVILPRKIPAPRPAEGPSNLAV